MLKTSYTMEEFDETFKPIDDQHDQTWQFESKNEATKEAEKLSKEHPYRHIWTVVDGDDGSLVAINGYHLCNRLFYIVCETPWGEGLPSDKDIYIEAEY
jgi:hypothetical protein